MQPCLNPRGTTTLPLFKEGVPVGGGSFESGAARGVALFVASFLCCFVRFSALRGGKTIFFLYFCVLRERAR